MLLPGSDLKDDRHYRERGEGRGYRSEKSVCRGKLGTQLEPGGFWRRKITWYVGRGCGSQRVGDRGWSRKVTLKSLDIFPQSKEAAWSAAGGHSSSPQWWAGGAILKGVGLWKVPHVGEKHRRRREVDGFGTCLASTRWTCGETAGGRGGGWSQGGPLGF